MNIRNSLFAFCLVTLLLAGCEKSAPPNNTQSATSQQSPAQGQTPAPDANSAMNQQASPQTAPAETPAPAPVPPPAPPQPIVVPSGTSVPIILGQALSSKTSTAGEEFTGSLAKDISVDEAVAIPKGADVRGVVTKAQKQGTFKGQGDLAIRLTSIRVNGKSYPISSSTYAESVKGKGKRTGKVTGGGAIAGALIGGIAGGGKGAAIGAGVGAGAGLAVSGATGGENVNLAVESRVNFKLTQALTIEPPAPPAQ
jgi:hypothetical protein